jgi:hypothetical protein
MAHASWATVIGCHPNIPPSPRETRRQVSAAASLVAPITKAWLDLPRERNQFPATDSRTLADGEQ